MAQNLFHSSSFGFEEKVEFLPADPTVLRKRGMEIDTSELFQSLDNDQPLILNLFSDVEIQATIQESRPISSGGSFSSGSLEDGGSMTLMISKEGIIRGEVRSASSVYMIRSDRDNRNQVIIKEIDISQIPRGDDVREINPGEIKSFLKNFSPETRLQSEEARQTLPENQSIDLLVVYTTGAKDIEGSTADIEATIEYEVQKTNTALIDSGLSNRKINLVALKELNYTQSATDMGDDLDRLKWNATDHQSNDPTGIMDEVHKLRDQYGADFVHLFVRDSDSTSTCGIATIYTQLDEEEIKIICERDFPNNAECVPIEDAKVYGRTVECLVYLLLKPVALQGIHLLMN